MNCTAIVLQALTSVAHDASIIVALSSNAPHLDDVYRHLGKDIDLRLDVVDMADLMADADFAIGAPGASAFERAVLGLPSILFTFAKNQRGVARIMGNAGAIIDAGVLDSGLVGRLQHLLKDALEDSQARRRMAAAASSLIDGRGALRIRLALCIERNPDGADVTLRLAAAEDEEWLFWLQCQPKTRQYFRNPAIPTAVEHHAWMQRTLSDENRMLLIVESDRTAAGMLRLDGPTKTNNERVFEISIVVDPALHGRGIGSAALRLVRKLIPNAVFDATVHEQNASSRALFRAAGFAELSHEHYRSMPA
jgi:RimJ/RimL family protein N-acetyltransferase